MTLDPTPDPADQLTYYGFLKTSATSPRYCVGLERDHPSEPWYYEIRTYDGPWHWGKLEDSEGRHKGVGWAILEIMKIVNEMVVTSDGQESVPDTRSGGQRWERIGSPDFSRSVPNCSTWNIVGFWYGGMAEGAGEV